MKFLFLCLLFLLPVNGFANNEYPIHIDTKNESDHIVLSVHFDVPVSRDVVWKVLTDFENMTHYLPYLSESKILIRSKNFIRVQQKGTVPIAFFNISYESTRNIDLYPEYEIHSSTSDGNSGLTCSVSKITINKNVTEVDYHADWWPTSQMVAGFGMDTVRSLLLMQFNAMQQEMLKRQLSQKAKPPVKPT